MELINGDCLEEMKNIPDKSVDMILCDFYGKAEIRFLKGRLKFIDMDFEGEEKDRKLSPAPFPSMIVIFKNDAFCEVEE